MWVFFLSFVFIVLLLYNQKGDYGEVMSCWQGSVDGPAHNLGWRWKIIYSVNKMRSYYEHGSLFSIHITRKLREGLAWVWRTVVTLCFGSPNKGYSLHSTGDDTAWTEWQQWQTTEIFNLRADGQLKVKAWSLQCPWARWQSVICTLCAPCSPHKRKN